MQRPAWQPSLFIGVIFGLFGLAPLTAIGLLDGSGDWERWNVFNVACTFAQLALVTYGLFGLATRLAGSARTLVLVAAVLTGVLFVWEIVQALLLVLSVTESHDLWRWSWRVIGTSQLAATIILSIAARAWVRQPLAAIGAVLAAGFSAAWPFIDDELLSSLWESHRILFQMIWPVREILWTLGTIGMLHELAKLALPPAARPDVAARGLRRTAVALAVVAGGIGAIGLVANIQSSPASMLPLLWYWGPAAVALALVVGATGLLDVERSWVAGLPRVRLALGATALLWWASLTISQIFAAEAQSGDYLRYRFPQTEAWTVLGPAFALVGLGLVGSALATFARSLDKQLQAAVATRVVVFFTLAAVGVAIAAMLSFMKGQTANLAILSTGFIVAALAVVVMVLARVAKAIAAQPALPAATVRL